MRHTRGLAAAAILAGLLAVGTVGAAPAPQKAGEAGKTGAVVDLNVATEAQLQDVPGIGPSLAKKIVEFRKENGPFKTVDDLMKIRGIGEKSIERLRPYLTVGKK